jgi:hypothetical protein
LLPRKHRNRNLRIPRSRSADRRNRSRRATHCSSGELIRHPHGEHRAAQALAALGLQVWKTVSAHPAGPR